MVPMAPVATSMAALQEAYSYQTEWLKSGFSSHVQSVGSGVPSFNVIMLF